MDRDAFWQVVEAARAQVGGSSGSADDVAGAVADRLAAMPPEEIIGFGVVFGDLQSESYRWELWAAAYLVLGGCSDDGFDYFRGWLVAQGRAAWEAALADPDSLAGLVDLPGGAEQEAECEEMLHAACSAYERVTGGDEAYWSAMANTARRADAPAGDHFDFDDEDQMRSRLPRLATLCLDGDDG